MKETSREMQVRPAAVLTIAASQRIMAEGNTMTDASNRRRYRRFIPVR